MKKIVKTMLVILMSVITLTGKAKDPYHCVVEGSYLADKNIQYTIFKMDKNGDLIAIEHVKSRKHYFVECNVGDKYLVRFQNKQGDVKFLMINASKHGYFQANIDWSVPTDGMIKVEKTGYKLTRIKNELKDPSFAQK